MRLADIWPAESKPRDLRQYYPGLHAACLKAYRFTIDAIREAAREKGYAVGVHGSLARDIDLIACPWTEDAAPAEELAEAIRAAAERTSPCGVAFVPPHRVDYPIAKKPHGRMAWSFVLGAGVYIDLSVMPRQG